MSEDEFVHAVVLVTTHTQVDNVGRAKLKALFCKVREETREQTAYELAKWVDNVCGPPPKPANETPTVDSPSE